ncbi:TIR domain-containing protein [Streptomyces sioyaensis]|uniref:TIR domain-containing protein n=1 Tax=Streptomyces sioyaensis TaxID=67364 RepID=UPI0036A70A37
MNGPLPPGQGRFHADDLAADTEDSPCWYFLSYSEQDELRSRVQQFHHDIQSEVRGLLGKDHPGAGFMDVEDIEPSERWRPRIWNSARRAHCMIALYSASYFGSDWCGREWAVFVERIRRQERQGGRARHLIGLVWRRGPKPWPDGVDEYQYVSQAFGSMYEKHGLFHVVPAEGPAGGDYWELVREVALEVARAVTRPEIPAISADAARTVVPLFGQSVLRPVDIVVSHADAEADAAWGRWMTYHLGRAGYDVAAHVLSPDSRDTVHVMRNSLRRARKVIVVLSEQYLSTGDMTDTVLDEALSDGSSDWHRLFPIVLHPGLERPLPSRLRQISDVRIGGPDEVASREVLLRVASAPLQKSERRPVYPGLPSTAAHPVFPGEGTLPLRTVVDALGQAISLREPSVRGVWLAETGLDVSSLHLSLPLRPLLFEIARACREQTGGYERLSDALDRIEPHSPASRALRRAVEPTVPPAE